MKQPSHNIDEAFSEGALSHARGEPMTSNPYQIDSECCCEWINGWEYDRDIEEDDDERT